MTWWDEAKWLVGVAIGALPGIGALALGITASRRALRKENREGDLAEDQAEARAAETARNALSADQRTLFLELRADLSRVREEREAERRDHEATRAVLRAEQKITGAWRTRAHEQHHRHNGDLQLMRYLPNAPLPHPWPDLPRTDDLDVLALAWEPPPPPLALPAPPRALPPPSEISP